jgi:alkylated DNA repair dioxygenase AlkB
MKTWETSPGKLMNHPFFCVGHNWKPYEYYKGDVQFPGQLQMMWSALLRQCPDLEVRKYLIDAHNPDTAIVNWYPPDSSLAMHVDKSEDLELQQQGSPIVTIALGANATVKIGGFNKLENVKSKSVIMRSGDVLLMYGESRTRLHSVAKIHENSEPVDLLQTSGRISVTMRRAKL